MVLTNFIKQSEEINRKDYEAMIKDFETKERRKAMQKKTYERVINHNREYKKHIKEINIKREEEYIKKNKDLQDRLKKKDQVLLTALENSKGAKLESKKKNIELLLQKEEQAKKNVEKNLMQQEVERIKNAEMTFKKSNFY